MDYTQEILNAIEESNSAFEQFKGSVLERLSGLEVMEAKFSRPHLGGDYTTRDNPAERKAFAAFVKSGDTTEFKALSIGSGPDGGFAVPKVIDSMIDAVAVNISPIRQLATVVQISTPDFHRLVNRRGTASGWVGETQARPATAGPQFEDVSPPMGEIYANLMATQQMLEDVFFNADSWIVDEIGTEFAKQEAATFVSGTGVLQPIGFLTIPRAATADGTRAFGTLEYVATGASGAFKTLSATVNPADDLFVLVSKLKAEYRAGAVFLMSKATKYTVMGFKDYQGRFLFNIGSGPDVQDTLLGYPIVEAEDMPAIGADSFSIAFGNFQRGYLIVDRIGTNVIRDPFSSKPYVSFYARRRTGGSPLNTEAIKLLKFGSS